MFSEVSRRVIGKAQCYVTIDAYMKMSMKMRVQCARKTYRSIFHYIIHRVFKRIGINLPYKTH